MTIADAVERGDRPSEAGRDTSRLVGRDDRLLTVRGLLDRTGTATIVTDTRIAAECAGQH